MDERQIIVGFLFPPHQQAAGAVGPRMASFHDPTAGTLSGAANPRVFPLGGDVGHVTEATSERFRRLAKVAFVQTQMLLARPSGCGTSQRHRLQCGPQQFGVVTVGAVDGNAQRDAAGVSDDRAFDAELAAIRWVFPGFFPHPAAPWFAPRPNFATASRCRVACRRFAGISSRNAERRAACSTLESTDAPCWTNQTEAAAPSTGNLYAAGKRYRRPLHANSHADDLPWGCDDTWATATLTAATFSPAFARTDHSNRDAYTPPCKETETATFRSTHGLTICSPVLG